MQIFTCETIILCPDGVVRPSITASRVVDSGSNPGRGTINLFTKKVVFLIQNMVFLLRKHHEKKMIYSKKAKKGSSSFTLN